MAKVGDVFRSSTWKAADLETPQVLTIEEVKTHEFDDGPKLILNFKEDKRGLICNRTNSNTIVESYGDETDDWIGKKIQLYKSRTEFQGRMVDCVRVQGPKSTAAAPPPADFGEAGDPGPDGDLPF